MRVSGAPLRNAANEYVGSFAVVTDISDQVSVERELRQSNQRITQLLESARKRAAHLGIINQVARLVLSTLDLDEILHRVVHAVHEYFDYHHTTLFLVEEDTGQMIMRAHAGGYETYFFAGYRQEIGRGIVGVVVDSGEPLLANDTATESRRILAFPEEEATRAELCVPIKIGDQVIGALDVQSQQPHIFDENDLASLQILADQVAWVIHNAQLFQETSQLKEFSEQVLQAIPLPVLLLDGDLGVVSANPSYCEQHRIHPEHLIGRPLEEAVPGSIAAHPEFRQAIGEVFRTGESRRLDRLRIHAEAFHSRTVDLLLTRVEAADGNPLALVAIEDITESLEKAYQSSLLRQIGQTMQGIMEMDRLLYALLTCVTAGTALGFNRAILLLVDQERHLLVGEMGVGPSSHEEAARIWAELAQQNPTVDRILAEYDHLELPQDSPLAQAVRQIVISLDDPHDTLVQVVREGRTITVTEDEGFSISPGLWAALGTHYFVAVPLAVRGRVIGAIVADNYFSGAPISDESVELLSAFAGHAALALENAELYHKLEGEIRAVEDAYRELERTQEELVVSERMAVIGEMSVHMAHEIRNPLATIGGFARSLLRKFDPDRAQTAAAIIVEEVNRLENLLARTLSFTKPTPAQVAASDLNEIYRSALDLLEADLADLRVACREELDPVLPRVDLDAPQVKQVLINVLQNAVHAMPEGGELHAATRSLAAAPALAGEEARSREGEWVEIEIRDTGKGIPEEHLKQIFSPFFTTKTHGTGLGLPICRKIVEDHTGYLAIESPPDGGTVVRIGFPCRSPEGGQRHEDHLDR